MKVRRILRAAALPLLLAPLSGCENVRDAIGLGKTSPNALRVIKQDPIAVPPDLELRPPLEARAAAEARTGDAEALPAAPAPEDISAGEAALLEGARTAETDPEIRDRIEVEAVRRQEEEEDESFLESLMFWRDSDDRPEPAAEEEAPAEEAPADGDAPESAEEEAPAESAEQ